MDLVVLPEALAAVYAGLVLACGAGLGFIAGRNRRRPSAPPPPPGDLERRLHLVERELELAQAELAELTAERDWMRRLLPGREDGTVPGKDDGALPWREDEALPPRQGRTAA